MSDNQNPNGVAASVPEAATKNQQEWREYCCQLVAEIDDLRAQVAKLRTQRRAYASLIPIPEDVKKLADLPVEELLAMCEGQPSIEDIIRESRQEHGK
jgi:hypothetical protein